MVRLISYPFRLGSDGSIVTIEDGADYYADELAMLLKTLPGERELVPEYGIDDPTFDNFSQMELLEKVSLFGPPVKVYSTTSRFTNDGRIVVDISYEELAIGENSGINDDYQDEYYDDEDDDEDLFGDDDFEEADSEFNFNDATD